MDLVLNLTKTPSQLFSKNLVRIKYIQHIQNDLTECGSAKLSLKIWFLNQAYIFQLIAFWQVFIEELAEYGFQQLESTEGIGAFRDIARSKLDESLKKFNTPSQENIDKLFKESLGIKKISRHWQAEGLSLQVAVKTLADLLETRHEIAHTGRTAKELTYESNFEKMRVLMEIAVLTEHGLAQELTAKHKASRGGS